MEKRISEHVEQMHVPVYFPSVQMCIVILLQTYLNALLKKVCWCFFPPLYNATTFLYFFTGVAKVHSFVQMSHVWVLLVLLQESHWRR